MNAGSPEKVLYVADGLFDGTDGQATPGQALLVEAGQVVTHGVTADVVWKPL